MNSVVLIGRLTRDPEVRYTGGQNNMAVATFSVAIDRPTKRGEEKKADFPRVTAFSCPHCSLKNSALNIMWNCFGKRILESGFLIP